MARKKEINLVDNFYFAGDLCDEQVNYMDKILEMGKVANLKDIFAHKGITLHDFQTVDLALAYIGKKFILGEKPGAGKTIIIAGILETMKRKKELKKKVLLTTLPESIYQFCNEIEYLTDLKINVIDSASGINRALKTIDEADGLIFPHKTVLSNNLNKFFANNLDMFDFFAVDESKVLKNKNNKTYEVIEALASPMEWIYCLNGTLFETNLNDIINQLKILGDNILPSMAALEKEYFNFDYSKGYWGTVVGQDKNGNYGYQRKFNRRRELAGYKNQLIFRDKLRYFYIRHNNKEIPHNIVLVPIELSNEQSKLITTANYDIVINSPSTTYGDFTVTESTVPKLEKALGLVEDLLETKPVVYVRFIESQKHLKRMLEEKGITCAVLNGEIKDYEERNQIREDFNTTDKYAVLITNIERAINLPNSDTLIFYNIPTNPQTAIQIMGRIDRNNYDVSKNYYFLCAIDTKEGENLLSIVKDRELNANLFTGSENTTFQKLAKDIEAIRRKRNEDKEEQSKGTSDCSSEYSSDESNELIIVDDLSASSSSSNSNDSSCNSFVNEQSRGVVMGDIIIVDAL